ncbi:MAG TPA: HEPN domain-containing protein [Polyangia bacterium]|jgi:HEPN domain-containing protein|nr:HEPN domain-containing protein [Polyangia bacterium]
MPPAEMLNASLDHLPEERRERLRTITQALVDFVPLEFLILFGSHARGDWVEDRETGYTSDFDFLAVVESETVASDLSLWSEATARARALAGGIPVQLIAHDLRYLNAEIRLGNYFFVDILREGVLLYDSRRFQLARPKALTREEMLALAEHNFTYWYGSASVFVQNCRYSAVQGRLAEAAFLLHQATERYHHALLLVFTAYKPRTHDLEDLGQRIERACPALAGALPRKGSEEDERLFGLLRRAYIDARYSKSYRITREELGELDRRVRELALRIRKACIERMESLCGKDAVRTDLPAVPPLDEPLLEALPMPAEPAAIEGWKRELIVRSEQRGREQGKAEGIIEGEARGIAEGERRGKAAGIIEGKAEAVLAVLAARGIPVDEAMRARVLGCQEEARLLRWLQRAATATTAEEALEEQG